MPHIPVEVEFSAKDHGAEGVLHHLAEGAEKLSERVDHVSHVLVEVLGIAGGLGAAFGFEHMIEEANEHVFAVGRLAAITGETTERADALSEVMHFAGLSAEETESVFSKMSLQALRMEDAMMGIAGPGGGAAMMQRTFAHLGVDIRQGVIPSLIQMAERAKEGKLHVMDLRLAFRGMPIGGAVKLLTELKRGPEAMKEAMEELLHSGTAVTAQNVAALMAMRRAKAEMSAAFERIATIVGTEVYPVLKELLEAVASQTKGWVEVAKEFGKYLGSYLREAIGLAATLGKVLLANFALMKMTGKGILGHVVALRGTTAVSAATGVGGLAQVVAGGTATLGAGAAAAQLGGLAIGAALASAALHDMAENTHGIRDFVFDALDRLITSISNVFGGILDDLKASDLWDMLGEILPMALSTVANALSGFVQVIQGLLRFIVHNVVAFETGAFWTKGTGAFMGIGEALDAVRAEAEAKVRARQSARDAAAAHATEGKPQFNQNFFNSRFDITQKFEEGFDPDRILTAFTNDLSALGERSVASGFQPAYAGTTRG